MTLLSGQPLSTRQLPRIGYKRLSATSTDGFKGLEINQHKIGITLFSLSTAEEQVKLKLKNEIILPYNLRKGTLLLSGSPAMLASYVILQQIMLLRMPLMTISRMNSSPFLTLNLV